MGLGMPIPDLSSKPGPGRPGYGPTGSYAFQFEVSAGQVGITVLPNTNGQGFTVKWQNGTEQFISAAETNLQSPTTQAGIISINKKTDQGFCDDFAVVSGQQFVTKVISWGSNPWNRLVSAFENCVNLTSVEKTKLYGVNTIMESTFEQCSSLVSADLSELNVSNNISIYRMFKDCTALQFLSIKNNNSKLNLGTLGTAQSQIEAFMNVGSGVSTGCEVIIKDTEFVNVRNTATVLTDMFRNVRFKDTSDLSGLSFSGLAFNYSLLFQYAHVTQDNSFLNISNWSFNHTNEWSSTSLFFRFNNDAASGVNTDIDTTGWNFGKVTGLSQWFYYCNIRTIRGLSTWTRDNSVLFVTLFRAFSRWFNAKIPSSDNFSSSFWANSRLSGNQGEMFQLAGSTSIDTETGSFPNLNGLALNAYSCGDAFRGSKWNTRVDFTGVSQYIGSGQVAATDCQRMFQSINVIGSDQKIVLNIDGLKILNARTLFYVSNVESIDVSSVVDFSSCFNFQFMFLGGTPYYDGNVTLPTNIDFSSATSWNGSLATNHFPEISFSTCQIDNLIRRVHATLLTPPSASVNMIYSPNSQVTEAPSVVQAQEAELVVKGWSITANTTDAVMPFVYTTPINVNTPTTPTGSFTGGTFSSSDPTNIPVNATTGEIDTGNSGDTTIRYTLADGCYNEQAVSLVAFPLKLKHNVTSGVEKTITIDRIAKNADPVTVDWGDGQTEQLTYNGNGAVSHTYNSGNVGTTENPIASFGDADDTGRITGIYYNITGDDVDLLSIEQWGISSASYAYYQFGKCRSLQLNATDKPDLAQSNISFASMFSGCTAFTGNESMKDWNTSNVTAMVSMFRDCPNFNVSALNWDVSNVTNFTIMFYNVGGATTSGSFNGRLDNWDFSSSNNISNFMHGQRSFNNDSVNSWNVSTITSFSTTLTSCSSFNQDLDNWDVSSAVNLASLFYGCTAMNGNISNWDTRNVTNMSGTFRLSGFNTSNAGFNTNANNIYWNTSNVTNMSLCFYQKNGQITSISDWDTSSVQSFSNFAGATINFNPDIESWDVSSCVNFSAMINSQGNGGFNKDLSSWDVSSGTNFSNGLANTEVNFDLSSWVLTDAVAVYRLFLNVAEFNQNASSMVLGVNITRLDFIFYLSGIDAINFTDTIVGWAVQVFTNSAPYNVNASSLTSGGVNLISTRTSDNASGQTYAAKYGSDWTATGWTDAGDALNFLTTATASGGAGWTYST